MPDVPQGTLSLKNDRYINDLSQSSSGDNNGFMLAYYNHHIKVIDVLVRKKYGRIYNYFNKDYLYFRELLLIRMIKRIYSKRKNILIRRKAEKNKRLLLRELKSLPSAHLCDSFPGGYDYLKMLSKY